jgi:chaperone required for assembly of F1-ATPase
VKRFYKDVTIAEQAGGWQVLLDGRGIKTVGGAPQLVPTRALAEALAAEWATQEEEVDPYSLPLRDQTDFAIDHVLRDPGETITKLLGYAETDTLCYRADPEDALFKRQQEVWEPLVTAMEQREGFGLYRISGIIHRAQPKASIEQLREHLACRDSFTLAGLYTMTSLAASLCIGLAALEDGADPEHLWHVANLEEEWQVELWGRDEQAEEQRARRGMEFARAHHWIGLVRG